MVDHLTVEDIYEELLVCSAQRLLPGQPLYTPRHLIESHICRIVAAASYLAFSEKALERSKAYEIITRVVEITKNSMPSLTDAAGIILARLGNFPGQQLLRKRYPRTQVTRIPMSPHLALEALARRSENTVIGVGGKRVTLTDFQCDLYESLDAHESVSISAPTSAGKSYVLSLDIIRKIKCQAVSVVVYVVPTRALIRQVTVKISHDLRHAGLAKTIVCCVPVPVDMRHAAQGVVYVLTQERLVSLLSHEKDQTSVGLLIVDEAQGLGDGDRGIVLHSAIDLLLSQSPRVKMVFASPLSSNPEFLLDTFQQVGGTSWVESDSPVSRNLILVSEDEGHKSRVSFDLVVRGSRVNLGVCELGFDFTGRVMARRAQFAKLIADRVSTTIIYADRPHDTEVIAKLIIVGESEPRQLDASILDLIDFLSNHIHPDYGLIAVLRHRVAFHYGYMPGIVRSRIEDLCAEGKLRFICCTSTLFQGINLPARNIVLERPCRGTGEPMSRGDFLNLAGRAGRMRHEFHGNVWCLRPKSWKKQSFEGEDLQTITSTFEESLSDDSNPIVKAVLNELAGAKGEAGVAALGKVFSEFTLLGAYISTSRYRTPMNELMLREIDAKCSQILVSLPVEVFRRNAAVSPVRLQSLYDYVDSIEDLDGYLPPAPYDADAYLRLTAIFGVLREYLGRTKNRSHAYHSVVALQWMRGDSMRKIINGSIASSKARGKSFGVDDLIRSLTKTIEEDICYVYVKYVRAYIDILAIVLTRRNLHGAVSKIKPLHLFLECGTADPVTLSLISIGLSRVTSIFLTRARRRLRLSKAATPEECIMRLRGADLEGLDIPEVCREEVRALIVV